MTEVNCLRQAGFRWGIETLEWSLVCRSSEQGTVGRLRFRTYLQYPEDKLPVGDDARPWEERVDHLQVEVSGGETEASGKLSLLRDVHIRSLSDIGTARDLISSFVDEWITTAAEIEPVHDSDWEATVQAMNRELERFQAVLIDRRRAEYAGVLKQRKERGDGSA